MKPAQYEHPKPSDANERRKVRPVICYPVDSLVQPDLTSYRGARQGWEKLSETIVPPREARCFDVPAGCFFRIVSIEGPQVGDLNLWSAGNLQERFFSGKTRALHGTHLSPGTGYGRPCRTCGRWRRSRKTLSTGKASTNGAARCTT